MTAAAQRPMARANAVRLRWLLATVIGIASLPATAQGVMFQFQYQDPAGFGFNDPLLGAARRQALADSELQFRSVFGQYFSYSGNVVLNVSSEFTPGGALASAGSSLVLAGGSPAGFNVGDVSRVKMQSGNDLNGANADGTLEVNFHYNWQLNIQQPAGAGQFDFFSVMAHEFLHTMGWYSLINQNGSGPFAGSQNWNIYDSHLVNGLGQSLISPASFTLNNALWSAASAGPNAGVYFNGSFALGANGGAPVPLYTPSTWQEGSSVSHLADSFVGVLMTPSTGTGPGVRNLSAVEVGILQDLGYQRVTAVPEPATYALWLIGLAGLAGVRRRQSPA